MNYHMKETCFTLNNNNLLLQVSDFLAEEEEEEEPSLEISHRFKGRRQSSYFESNDKLQNVVSRTSDDALLQEFTTEFTRTGSRPKDNTARNSNFRQTNTQASRQLSLVSQSEPGDILIDSERDIRRQSYTRSRERNKDYDRNLQFSPQTEVPKSKPVSFQSGNDRITGRENKIRSRNQGHSSTLSTDRKPLLSVTRPEEFTTPSKSRFRQTIPSEEMSANRGSKRKDNRGAIKSVPDQERDPVRTFSSRTADTSSTRRPTRTKDTVLESDTQTQRYSRRQNSFSSNRNAQNDNIEMPKQDVETRIPNRRRVVDNERIDPVTVQESGFQQRKSSFSTEDREDKPIILRSKTSTPSVLTSKDLDALPKTVKLTSDILNSKISESGLPPSLYDVPILTGKNSEHEDIKSETLLETQTDSAIKTKEDTLNKALHARSRGRGSVDSPFSKREPFKSVPNLTQRRSQSYTDSVFPSRGKGLAERGQQKPSIITQENSTEEIRSFRSRLNNQPMSRVSSKDVTDQDDIDDSQQINRRPGSYETKSEAYATDNEKNISEKRQSSAGSGRRTISKLSGDSETSTKLSRGRGHSRLGVGSQREDEVSAVDVITNIILDTKKYTLL